MKTRTIVYCLFSALKPFRRNKIPPEKKIRAVELYLRGLSYRQVAEILEISHTIKKTVQKFAKTIYQPSQSKNRVAVDETVIKINGEKRYLWVAIDVESSSQSGLQQPETGGLPGISFWLF